MKLGEVKIEALKLMFANVNDDIGVESLGELIHDENYRSYLVGMTGSINRCFSVIEERRVLPLKARALLREEGTESGPYIRYELRALIGDYGALERISVLCDGEYTGSCPYFKEGDAVLLQNDGSDYTVIYRPKIRRVVSFSDNEEELSIPDDIAAFIPYFVKGDLYRSEDPHEASEARNWFEAALDEISESPCGNQASVKTVYSQTEAL